MTEWHYAQGDFFARTVVRPCTYRARVEVNDPFRLETQGGDETAKSGPPLSLTASPVSRGLGRTHAKRGLLPCSARKL